VADIGSGDVAERCDCCGRCGPGEKFATSEKRARSSNHRTSAGDSRRIMPMVFDSASTLLRRLDESRDGAKTNVRR